MMSSTRKRRKSQSTSSVDLTPMLDIVFILLIFFIVSAVFLNEQGLDLTQPVGEGVPINGAINVRVFTDGSASVNGYRTDVGAVPARVEMVRANHPGAPVAIFAAHDTAFKNVIYLEDQFSLANISTSLKIDRTD